MTETCTNCNGEGLAGSGEKPWLREGKVITCPVCIGTGQVASEAIPTAEPVADVPPSEVNEPVEEVPTVVAPVNDEPVKLEVEHLEIGDEIPE